MNAKRYLVLVSSICLALLFNAAAEANPEAAVDFSQTTSSVPVVADDEGGDDPTVLSTVEVKCPKTGFLVARADAGFDVISVAGGLNDQVSFRIDLGKDHSELALNHNHFISFPLFRSGRNEEFSIPGSIQRIDRCEAGTSHTYRFGALFGPGARSVDARQPNLVVEFFRDRM